MKRIIIIILMTFSCPNQTNPSLLGRLWCQLNKKEKKKITGHFVKSKKRSSLENDHQNIAFVYSVDDEERICTHKYFN